MKTATDELAEARLRLKAIQASPLMGVCFLDEHNCLMQIFESDVDFKLALVEYYQQRVDQLIRSERAANAVARLTGQV